MGKRIELAWWQVHRIDLEGAVGLESRGQHHAGAADLLLGEVETVLALPGLEIGEDDAMALSSDAVDQEDQEDDEDAGDDGDDRRGDEEKVAAPRLGEVEEIHRSHKNREGEEKEENEGRIELLDPETGLEVPVLLELVVERIGGLVSLSVKLEVRVGDLESVPGAEVNPAEAEGGGEVTSLGSCDRQIKTRRVDLGFAVEIESSS